ncbi:E3 ubiquitin-protein ligase TRIM56 [Holothuria leucospilota]|uniref:E3 ubiquitin-protein ligase TRIM56 n=1 Tax=Holothuria leucospilota TaxID=206669 RepID=A0A9Q1BZK5_HOLLE|nr:E3 ubiquitin-protein ligase TRIM56 [Holothuria leucospilota]
MASSRSWLEDIDDEFCKCPICRQIFDKPKYLPCLHRFCSLCLKLLIVGHQGSLHCPECDEEFTVPKNGVDELKPDCFMENIVRYIKLVESFENNRTRECFGCSKLVKVTSYCFRCNDFLCKECERSHLLNKSLQEHQSRTLAMVGNTEKKATLAQVFAAMESTYCSCTPKKSFSLCNDTGQNHLPFYWFEHEVNIDCIRQPKQGDYFNKRIMLDEIKFLAQFKDNFYKMPFRLKRTKEMLESNVRDLSGNLLSKYEKEVQKRKERIEELKEKALLGKTAADKGDKIFDGSRKEEKHKVHDSVEVSEIEEEIKTLFEEYERLSKKLESKKNENERLILEISKQVRITIKQFNNFEITAESILCSNSNWVLVHCLSWSSSEIITVSRSLRSKMIEEFPKLETLSHVTFNDPKTPFLFLSSEVEVPTLSATGTCIDHSALVPLSSEHVRVHGFNDRHKGKLFIINDRESNDPKALIKMFRGGTYLSGINLRDCNMPRDRYYNGPYNCDAITSDKIVTLFHRNAVTMYNVSDISNITSKKLTWTEEADCKVSVPCFAVDHVNKTVYLPNNGTPYVYVLDEDLKHLRTLRLPLRITPRDMILKGDYLIICDESREAYAFLFRGLDGVLMFQFEKPSDISIHSVTSVCTDKRGFIYILWKSYDLNKAFVSQYSQCGHHLLKTTEIAQGFDRLRIRETQQGEQLLVWSILNKIYCHDLVI